MRVLKSLLFSLFFTAVLTGCLSGGGGGSGSAAKAITSFSLNGVTGLINETSKTIALTMPYGTNVTTLVATFTTTGVGVRVGVTAQSSGSAANDFTNPVNYTVVAEDGSVATYTVTVAVALSSAKAITAFSLAGVAGLIDETNKIIAVTMPFGTDVTALVATFTTTGASVAVGATEQISGSTPNDFTSPVSYVVSAADGTTASYTVAVAVAPSSAKAITAFSLAGVIGTINETSKTIAVTMPFGTDVTALVATFTTTGASVAVGATAQVSGTTANDFTSPVSYVVSAADGGMVSYVVTVAVAPSPAKAITAFSLAGVSGVINETNKSIAVVMPTGTDVTALVATFTTMGAGVTVGNTPQISGVSANNFSQLVVYTVTAADGTTANYYVSVAVAPSPAKAITAFSLAGVTGVIDETNRAIAVTMPFGTNVSALVASFTTTGISVNVGATAQWSGWSTNNFTNPVTYTVTAANGTTANYTVTVAVALNSAKAITAFSLGGVTGTISEANKTIAVTMPYGTPANALTTLVASFTTTGASVQVGGTPQLSGTTVNDFTGPVSYTVTAADGTTAAYTVTVTIALNPAKAITAFSLGGVTGTINETDKTISVPITSTSNVTALVASFTTTGASVKVGATAQVSGTTANDFTYPVTYVAVAADGTTANYRVTTLSQAVTYQIDPAHSGQTTMAGVVAFPAAPAWSVTLSGSVSYPLIAGGKVFVLAAVNGGTNLYALDKATGSIVWGPTAITGSYSSWAAHAYDRGRIFVVNGTGLLKTFDANTGVAGWSAQVTTGSVTAAPTAANGIVYVGAWGAMYALDETNGSVLWRQYVANGDISSPTVSGDGVFVTYPCQAYKFDPVSGASLWRYNGPCSGGGGATAVYANGSLYMRDYPYMTGRKFDAATGAQTGTFTSTEIPAITSQAGFMLSGGTLRAVDLASNNVLWSFAGDGSLAVAPIVINQYVIVASGSGNFYALDAASGTQVWSGNAGAAISAYSLPITGLGAGEEYLVIPAGNKLTAWKIAP